MYGGWLLCPLYPLLDKIKFNQQQVAENTRYRPIPFNADVNIASLLVRQNLLASSDIFRNKIC